MIFYEYEENNNFIVSDHGFCMVSFSACSDEDTIGGGEGLSKDFVVSRSDMAFTKNGGETDLYVKAAQVPTVSTEAAWLAVTPVAGSSSITHHFLIKQRQILPMMTVRQLSP